MINKRPRPSVDQATYSQMNRLYLIALSAILAAIIFSQVLIQGHLNEQVTDSRVINVAGRQRMLSQRLTKEVLLLGKEGEDIAALKTEIDQTLQLWIASHEGLLSGNREMGLPVGKNSAEVQAMFEEVVPYYEAIVNGVQMVLRESPTRDEVPEAFLYGQEIILQNEPLFLKKMDQIVFQYDKEAKSRVNVLKEKEFLLLLISLAILVIEVFVIFRPLMNRIRHILQSLLHSEKEARMRAEENEILYQEKSASLQELQALTYAVDKAALFASVSLDGELIYASDRFKKTLLLDREKVEGQLPKLIAAEEKEQEIIESIILGAKDEVWQGEVRISQHEGKTMWLDVAVVPVSRIGAKQQLWICYDTTARKEAQLSLERLTQERFDAEMKAQQLRSVQIIKAQEEERKRIAKEIHDGIGQMLTAIKFQLQGLNPEDIQDTTERQQVLQDLTMRLIRGTRIATFNLTPPELGDYGLSSALAKLAKELSKLTGKRILFHNRTDFDQRFDTIVETNLFRITQEAVNNALKYAQSSFVLINLSHSESLLSITVDDDGVGFDMSKQKRGDRGMGMAFMQERTRYIEGRLFISSAPGEGTRITVNMPITASES